MRSACVSVGARACACTVGSKADGLVRVSQRKGLPVTRVRSEEAQGAAPVPGSGMPGVSGRKECIQPCAERGSLYS